MTLMSKSLDSLEGETSSQDTQEQERQKLLAPLTDISGIDLGSIHPRDLQQYINKAWSKLNTRQFTFAKAILSGKSNRDAFKAAGYNARNDNSMDATASILLRSAKVSLVVTLEREMQFRVSSISKESIVARLEALATKAEDKEDYNSAKACLSEAAKLTDQYPATKSESTVTHKNEGIRGIGADDWADLFAQAREKREAENVGTKH